MSPISSEQVARNDLDHSRRIHQCRTPFPIAEAKRVVWEAPAAPVAGYVITRTERKTGEKRTIAQPKSSGREFKDWHVDPSGEYEYTVQSRDAEWRLSEGVKGKVGR